MIDIDHLYDRVKADSSLENLLDIIEIVVSSNSFKEDSFTISALFVKISEQKECTDKMIERMYQYQIDNYLGRSHIWKMMNNGSKKLFDKLWGDDVVYTKRDLDIMMTSVPFSRRLSAEQYRLKSLEKHYRDNGDIETAEMYNNEHKNLEQDHPEWLI